MDTIESATKTVLAACGEGYTLRTNLAVLKRFTKYEPIDMIGTRRKVAARLIQAEWLGIRSPLASDVQRISRKCIGSRIPFIPRCRIGGIVFRNFVAQGER